jgi:hypothetical protein
MQLLRPTRSTSIHQAISHALTASEPIPITVSHILPLYIRFAGFDKLCHDALVAFEHAMEKGRVVGSSITPPDSDQTDLQAHPTLVMGMLDAWQVEVAVVKLRDEYWKRKLGGEYEGKETKVCTCEECGRMRLVKPNERDYYDEDGSKYVVMKAKDLRVVSSDASGAVEGHDATRTKRKVRKTKKKAKSKKTRFVQGLTATSCRVFWHC